jgi:hypothetical protein
VVARLAANDGVQLAHVAFAMAPFLVITGALHVQAE